MNARHLTDEPIDSRTLAAQVLRRSDGALLVFEGVVRDHHEGRAVTSIFYDAYRPMAEKEIDRIVREAEARFPGVALSVLHRLGSLEVGETSIAIAAASAHRAEAFDAVRMTIDRIKQTVPIWKKERGAHGEEWQGWQC